MDTVELRQRRAGLWEQAKSIHALAEREKRPLSAEERAQWERINVDIDNLKETIDRQERIAAIDTELNAVPEPVAGTRQGESRALPPARPPVDPAEFVQPSPLPDDPAYTRAFRSYIRRGLGGMLPDQRAILMEHFGVPELGPGEKRALGTPTTAGGATIPQEFYRRLIEALKAFGGMRQRAGAPGGPTVIQTDNGATMPVPSVDDTGNIGAILAENTQVTEQDILFATRNLDVYMYTSKLVRASLQILQDTAFDLDTWLIGVLAARIGRATNAHFTTGTGTGQPQGIVTGSTQGSLGAVGSTTTVTYAKLLELEHSVDPAFRALGAQWMFHDTTLRALKSLVDGQSRPLWLPGLAVQAPDSILGYPYVINQDVAQMAANAKSILFGNFSAYIIRDAVDVRVLRLDERYADFLQVGFLGFMRTGGVFANPDSGAANSPVKHYANSAT